MKKNYFILTLFLSIISFGVWAECPYSIKDASVMLTLPNQTNLKFTSSSMCNQKEYFADRFFDAEVEIWKKGKLVGKFYSRRVTYDTKTLKIVLQNAVLLESDIIHDKKFKNVHFIVGDLKNSKLSTSAGEIRF